MVEHNKKLTPMTSVHAGSRVVLALVLAGVLAFVPLADGLGVAAWADEDESTPNAVSTTSLETPDPTTDLTDPVTPSTDPETPPTDPETPPTDPETPPTDTDSPSDIRDVVTAAGVIWADAFIHYMDGNFTEEELLSIDADFFDNKDAALAQRIRDDQQAVIDGNESGEDSGKTSDANGSSSESSSAANQDSSSAAVPEELAGTHIDPSTDQYFSKPDGLEADTGPFTFSPNPTTDEFINSIAEQARQIGQESDLYASVMIAQAILESGSGSSLLSKAPHYNLFGIKGSYRGSSVNMKTAEDDGTGSYYEIVSAFRSYPSTRESLSDYAELLTGTMGSFYAPVLKSHTSTFNDACDYLQGHYATSTSYSAKLKAIIDAYDLTTYDNKIEEEPQAEPAAAVEPMMPVVAVQMPVETPPMDTFIEPQQEIAPVTLLKQMLTGAALVLLLGCAYGMDVYRKKKQQHQTDASRS